MNFCEYFLINTILWTSPGTSGSSCGLQKFPKNKDCDVWDWYWAEWRLPCHTRHGWVWRPILRYRWWWPTSDYPSKIVRQEQIIVQPANHYRSSSCTELEGLAWLNFNVWGLQFQFFYNFDTIEFRVLFLDICFSFFETFLCYTWGALITFLQVLKIII